MMKNIAVVSALSLILLVGIVSIPSLTASVFADSKCEPKDGQNCVFNLKRGDIEIEDDLVIGPFNIGSSGNGSGIDQTARDGVAELRAANADLQNSVDAANGVIQGLNQTVVSQQSEVSSLSASVATLEAIVQNLSNNAITDIVLNNGTAVVIEPPVEPPVDTNNTNGNVTNGNVTG